ncbi:hypothetical protein OG728_00465 [Streptomyces microflavus]|uniref:hypothetical protein n=1 Tax=Streptomyces microflavus TaxID=1919 RepID=UPI002E13624D|nr:hypothetical protein OG728_00465 [Streptomyces microflavus]
MSGIASPGPTPSGPAGLLLAELHRDLLALDAEYHIESSGSKFGPLRVTVCDRFQEGEFDR